MTDERPILIIDPGRLQQLTLYDNSHQLTPREERCLTALAMRPQHVISHDELYRAVWGHETVEPAEIAGIISRLRRLGVPIVTVERRGYMLQMPKEHIQICPPP